MLLSFVDGRFPYACTHSSMERHPIRRGLGADRGARFTAASSLILAAQGSPGCLVITVRDPTRYYNISIVPYGFIPPPPHATCALLMCASGCYVDVDGKSVSLRTLLSVSVHLCICALVALMVAVSFLGHGRRRRVRFRPLVRASRAGSSVGTTLTALAFIPCAV